MSDVLTWRHPTNNKLHCYCVTCGQQKRIEKKELTEHTKICTSPFKPLQLGKGIPNDIVSAYSNLEEHIVNHEFLKPKKWTVWNSSRVELRRTPKDKWPPSALRNLTQALNRGKEGIAEAAAGLIAPPLMKKDIRIEN